MAFQDYSTNPASNTSIGASIYIGPDMARNDVREALQTLAADGRALSDEMLAYVAGGAVSYYSSTAEGLAATPEGQLFGVNQLDGTANIYLHNPGPVATLQFSIPTVAALAASTGADLVGKTGGGTVQDALDVLQTSDGKAAIGTAPLSSKFTIQTATSFTGNAMHLYHYAQQSDTDNQTIPLAIHNYTDGVGFQVDGVGAKATAIFKQAYNDTARPGYGTGTGVFLQGQRARPAGGGIYPSGNLGSGNDRMFEFNTFGNLCFDGSDAQEWDGSADKAPIQVKTYELNQRKLYLGYRNDLNQGYLGCIDGVAADFRPLIVGASAIKPIGDAASADPTSLGSESERFSDVRTVTVHIGSGTRISSGTGSPEGVLSGNRGDTFHRTDGGAGTCFYVKESGDGTVNGWAAK